MKIMICLGTRPEIIKMSTVIKELKKVQHIECVVCLSGQHKELAEDVAEELGIDFDYNLSVMRKDQSLQYILSAIIVDLARVIRLEKPDYIVVHGDTSTCFASSLCSFYEQIPVIYVEAGWRSSDIKIPFPEEMHRCLVTKIAQYFICSTEGNCDNLISEGVDCRNIFVAGNPIVDVLKQTISAKYIFDNKILNDFINKKIVLITFHRRENRDKVFTLLKIINKLACEKNKLVFLWIVHPNNIDFVSKLFNCTQNFKFIKPLGIYDMHNLIFRSVIIITDSGGIQEEANILKRNTIILRKNIEREELIDSFSVLAEVKFDCIKKYIEYFLNKKEAQNEDYKQEASVGKRISDIIQEVSCGKENG